MVHYRTEAIPETTQVVNPTYRTLDGQVRKKLGIRQLFEPESGEEDPHRGCAHGGAPDAVSEVTYIKRA
ncbi:MAG: hypothetical protein ACREXW_12250 [Gammaproteobacteria bacterium]